MSSRGSISRRSRSGGGLFVAVRLMVATLALVGPLFAVTATTSEGGLLSKRGAGLVLFVSLQRQSMS